MSITIDSARLWDSLMAMAAIGATPAGGCNRQALTDEDGQGRRQLALWGAELGLQLSVDRLGNMMLTRAGTDASLPVVAMGSHLDTQPTGGRFDGVLGVLAGLEVMRALHGAGIATRAPLALVNWTNEEGARFAPPMMGSGAAMGLFTEAEILGRTAIDGARFGDELARIGWQGSADPSAMQRLGAYFELHIEQGPVLERENLTIGVVTGSAAQQWYDIEVTGAEAHAGAPMQGRRDTLMAAAAMMNAAEAIVLERNAASGGGEARCSVGRILPSPGSRNVVPGKTWFSLDLREEDAPPLAALCGAVAARLAAIAAERDVDLRITPFWDFPRTPFDTALVGHVREAATARGFAHRDMATAIGHDAVYVARKLPTAMIFVPCHGGISHNEAESITQEWAAAGCQVLADAALAAAGRA
ncbi:MAG: allantoate amidohydrolase [Acetobacteraceae bacterium]|nr:allantoate amidohydrolase [Acetobacteraceae bacterium]